MKRAKIIKNGNVNLERIIVPGKKTVIDNLILACGKCTVCGADYGKCDCWTKCDKKGCMWSYRKGEKCRNPAHENG